MRDDGQRLADIVEAAKAVVNYVRSAPAGESAAPQLIDATFFIVWRDVEAGAFDELIKACERWLAARSQ